VVAELAAEFRSEHILVNAIRIGCLPQQSALPMLLSAAEAKKGFVLGCRDQGTLSNPCGEIYLWWNKLNQ